MHILFGFVNNNCRCCCCWSVIFCVILVEVWVGSDKIKCVWITLSLNQKREKKKSKQRVKIATTKQLSSLFFNSVLFNEHRVKKELLQTAHFDLKCKLKRIQIQILCIPNVQHGLGKCGFSFRNAHKSRHIHTKSLLCTVLLFLFVDGAFFLFLPLRSFCVLACVHVCEQICKCKLYADELLLSILLFRRFGRSNFRALYFLIVIAVI